MWLLNLITQKSYNNWRYIFLYQVEECNSWQWWRWRLSSSLCKYTVNMSPVQTSSWINHLTLTAIKAVNSSQLTVPQAPEWSNEVHEHQLFNFIERDMSFLLIINLMIWQPRREVHSWSWIYHKGEIPWSISHTSLWIELMHMVDWALLALRERPRMRDRVWSGRRGAIHGLMLDEIQMCNRVNLTVSTYKEVLQLVKQKNNGK